MLYSSFENQAKYYLANQNTLNALARKYWIWKLKFAENNNEPLLEEKVREQM